LDTLKAKLSNINNHLANNGEQGSKSKLVWIERMQRQGPRGKVERETERKR
jgi:hypothetical protein